MRWSTPQRYSLFGIRGSGLGQLTLSGLPAGPFSRSSRIASRGMETVFVESNVVASNDRRSERQCDMYVLWDRRREYG